MLSVWMVWMCRCVDVYECGCAFVCFCTNDKFAVLCLMNFE